MTDLRHLALALGLLLIAAGIAAEEPEDDWDDDPWSEETSAGPSLHGFVEGAYAARLRDDDAIGQGRVLSELRLRLESEKSWEALRLTFKGDGLYDDVVEGWDAELRELALSIAVSPSLDLKLGRQVLTWGTGDLLFLNDLFAKDFESFFSGRTDDYLKAPEDAVRLLVYGERFDVDLVWAPIFEPDNFLDGERFSFFSAAAGGSVAPDPPLDAIHPARTFDNGELSLRLSRTRDGVERALYLHRGFFQQPTALDDQGRPTFAPLQAVGASMRRPAWGGLTHLELVLYDSIDDRGGGDPNVPNGQLRALFGHERELARSLTGGVQYYLEWTLDHDDLVANSPFPQFEPDELRHVLTGRLTRLTLQDRLRLSAFVFFSPSDADGYLRGEASYRIDDHFSVAAGFNLFEGHDPQTFFAQLEDGSNAYVRGRYAF